MNNSGVILAKLAGLLKILQSRISENLNWYTSESVIEYFIQFKTLKEQLINLTPLYFSELPTREIPSSVEEYIHFDYLATLKRDLLYIFEVWANIGDIKMNEGQIRRIFISHGRSAEWYKVQAYIERDIKIPTLELAQEANQGRTILQKLNEESEKCSYAVIVMTGDDEQGKSRRARENVMHEIGFFQGKYGLQNVCLLYEEGTSIPSNIHGLVYIPFPKEYVDATFGVMRREIETIFNKLISDGK